MARLVKTTTEDFIKKAEKVHGVGTYDYSKTVYQHLQTKVEIICPVHGSFFQTPAHHLYRKQGCILCGYKKTGEKRALPKEEFITRAKETHEDKYDYSKVNYVNTFTNVEIICPIHGAFWQSPQNHIRGKQGCPECGRISTITKLTYPFEKFLEDAKRVHGDKYDYSKVTQDSYDNSFEKVEILCKEHGSFWQSIASHKRGSNCPKCKGNISVGEQEVMAYILSLGITAERKKLDKQEIDIFIPEKNIGIEYNGLYWHSEEYRGKIYHLDKTKACEKESIRLIHIFEDEWLTKQELVKKKLAHILGVSKQPKIGARETRVVHLSTKEIQPFLEANHIQGYIAASVKLGLKDKPGNLVAVATFSKSRFDKEDSWEVIRYATSLHVKGGFSKLLKRFLELKPEVKRLISYSDLRWSTGDVYQKTGFKLESVSSPGYYWCKGNVRYNRQRFMKHKLKDVLTVFDPDKTEEENCLANGYWKVYDCGQQKWVLKVE